MECIMLTLMLCAICTLHLWGHNVSRVLQRTAVDFTDAVMAGAHVQAVNQETAAERDTVTGAKGLFRLSDRMSETYKQTVEVAGFKERNQKKIMQVSSEPREFGNIKLKVGAISEVVIADVDVTPGFGAGSYTTDTQQHRKLGFSSCVES
jgi:hypothetical protein